MFQAALPEATSEADKVNARPLQIAPVGVGLISISFGRPVGSIIVVNDAVSCPPPLPQVDNATTSPAVKFRIVNGVANPKPHAVAVPSVCQTLFK